MQIEWPETIGRYIGDIQHAGKPGKNDRGAGRDLDNDGLIELHEMEAELTPVIHGAMWARAGDLNIARMELREGWYSARHKTANDYAAGVRGHPHAYIAHHLNAADPDKTITPYSTFGYDKRSAGGRRLALHIVEAVSDAFPDRRVIARPCAPDDWTSNMFNTIKGIYVGPSNISGVCSEPLFMRELVGLSDADRSLLLQRMGHAMIDGIAACMRNDA